MAQMLCENHGTKPPSFVAPKVAEFMRRNVQLENELLKEIMLPLPFGKKGVFLVDFNFFQEFDVPLAINDEDSGFEIYRLLVPVCSSCLNEWKQAIDLAE